MPANPESRRRARRDRPGMTVRHAEAGGDALAAPVDQRPPSAHQLLGVRPGASRLVIVQGYQRALRMAVTDGRRRELAAAFRKLGAQPIRTRCPYGHHLALYAIDGDTHTAYCAVCYSEPKPTSTYRYIGWANATGMQSKAGEEMDPQLLPYGLELAPQADIEVHYRTPGGERALIFTMDATVRLRLHPADFFSVLYRGDLPWTLLNHTIAESFPLDPHYRHREQLDRLLYREDQSGIATSR